MHNVPTAAGDGAVVVVGRSQRVVPLLGRGNRLREKVRLKNRQLVIDCGHTDPGRATHAEGEQDERESEIQKEITDL